MKLSLVTLLIFLLAGCGATVTTPMGKMSESAYVQLETVKAVTAQNSAQVACFQAAGTIGGADTLDPAIASVNAMGKVAAINGCASGASMQQAQIPQYVPPRSIGGEIVDLVKTGIQYGVPGVVAIKQSGDARAIALGAQAAATAQNGQQWNGIGGIVRDTTAAQSATATGAVNAIAGVSVAASNNNAATATAYAQTLGLGFAMLPSLTPSITAGGNVVQGDGNDFSVDIRRDTLTAGTELRIDSPGPFNISTQYDLVCTTGNTGNGGSGTVPGGAGSAGAQNQTCQLVPKAK